MFALAVCLVVTVFAAIPVAVAVWWSLSVHRDLVLLSFTLHSAEEQGNAQAIARAEAALRARLARFPGGIVGRWMGVNAPRSPDTRPQAR
jgi:hypothetical protein